jgi:hypothetical protein
MVDPWWLVKNATYRPNCYMCQDANNSIMFHFYASPPQNTGKHPIVKMIFFIT